MSKLNLPKIYGVDEKAHKDIFAMIQVIETKLAFLRNKIFEHNSFFTEPERKSQLKSEITQLKYDLKIAFPFIFSMNGLVSEEQK